MSSETNDVHSLQVATVVAHNRRLLFECLNAIDGEKTIVWDRSLMRRVNVFAGPQVLAKHGVVLNVALDQVRQISTPHCIFLLAPTFDAIDELCQFIDRSQASNSLFYVYLIPYAWYAVRERLKEKADGKYFKRLEAVKELCLWWLPCSGDTLTLADCTLPSKLLLSGDWTCLHRCAVALSQLLSLCPTGLPIYSHSRSKWSHDVARMLHKMRSAEGTQSHSSSLNVKRLVLIDRWQDPLTPMLTQLTYSGLLDEMYTISVTGSIKVPESDFNETGDNSNDPFAMKEVSLNDELFERLKNVHVKALGQQFSCISAEIRSDEEHDREKMSIAEYQLLVKKMPTIIRKKNLASVHMRLAELVNAQLWQQLYDDVLTQRELLEACDGDKVWPAVEQAVLSAQDETHALRILATHSLATNALKPSVMQHYRRIFTQSYGTASLNRILKLQKAGILREKTSGKMVCEYNSPRFPEMKKQYKLCTDDVSEIKPEDSSYAYSGLASLLVRMLEEADKLKWTGWTCHGKAIDEDMANTAVFVVGGLTRAELAMLRLMPNVSLVLTTDTITAHSLIENIVSFPV